MTTFRVHYVRESYHGTLDVVAESPDAARSAALLRVNGALVTKVKRSG